MSDESEIVIKLAQRLVREMGEHAYRWDRAFIRFHHGGNNYGTSGSFIADGEVRLFDVFKHEHLMDDMRSDFLTLHSLLEVEGKAFCVALLIVDSHLNFKILFEHDNLDAWKIDKLDSDGIPRGFDNSLPLGKVLPQTSPKPWWKFWQ